MARDPGDVRLRLQQTALELFAERGYERTTAAEIAARAGVTERTFFRHFPDKREALFDGEAVLRRALTAAVEAEPLTLGALDTLFHAFDAVVPLLEGNRAFAEPRQAIIAATPALAERERAKTAALADLLAATLKARGVDDLAATLAANAGIAAFVHATVGWLADPQPGLAERLARGRQALKDLAIGLGD